MEREGEGVTRARETRERAREWKRWIQTEKREGLGTRERERRREYLV